MRGALGLFSLVDLLQLLGSNQSRGYLAIHHPVRGEGRIYLNGGRVVHVAFDGREDVEALQAMLRDERGNFEFLPGRPAPRETITSTLDNLLLAAIRTLDPDERPEEKEIPPPDELDVPTIRDVDRVSRLTLSAEEFSVIERIDGQRNVLQVAQSTFLSVQVVQRILMRLASLGVLEVKKRSPRIARLVIGMSRELTGMTVYIDDIIMRAWTRQFGAPVQRVRLRLANAQELVLAVASAPDLGAYLLFSNNALLRYGLSAGTSVLVKPED